VLRAASVLWLLSSFESSCHGLLGVRAGGDLTCDADRPGSCEPSIRPQRKNDRLGFMLNGNECLGVRDLDSIGPRCRNTPANHRHLFGFKDQPEAARARIVASHAETRRDGLLQVDAN